MWPEKYLRRTVAVLLATLTLGWTVVVGPLPVFGASCQDPAAGAPAADAPAEQTPAEQTPAQTPAAELPKDFDGLLAKWEETRKQMTDLRDRFDATTDLTEKDRLRVEFTALLDGSGNLLDRLRDAALNGLSAENLDAKKLNTLLGILVNEANDGQDDKVLATADRLFELKVPAAKFETASRLERLSIQGREIFEEILIRQREATADDLPRVRITTNRGAIELELFENEAPNTVANFITLAKSGFYNGTKFHRVIEGFMAQGGDPEGNGTGGPGYAIACECNSAEARRHFTASISMANAGRDTGGSQFFLTFSRSESVRRLDGRHTVFGRVISGVDVLDQLTRTAESTGFGEQPIEGAQPDVIEKVEVIRDRGGDYTVRKIGEESPASAAPESNPPTANPPEAAKDGAEKPAESAGGEQPPAMEPAGEPAVTEPKADEPKADEPAGGTTPAEPAAGGSGSGGGEPAGGGFAA